MVLIDFKEIIPIQTLERFRSYKEMGKNPLPPETITIKSLAKSYKIFYLIRLHPKTKSKMEVSIIVPKNIDYGEKFKSAVIAYLCEGDKPKKANGTRLGFNNSDWRLLRLVIDQFEKIGLERNRWNVRLELYSGNHNEIKEKKWWANRLDIPITCFSNPSWKKSENVEKFKNSHGRARIQRSSVIWSAIIDNLCDKVINESI